MGGWAFALLHGRALPGFPDAFLLCCFLYPLIISELRRSSCASFLLFLSHSQRNDVVCVLSCCVQMTRSSLAWVCFSTREILPRLNSSRRSVGDSLLPLKQKTRGRFSTKHLAFLPSVLFSLASCFALHLSAQSYFTCAGSQ